MRYLFHSKFPCNSHFHLLLRLSILTPNLHHLNPHHLCVFCVTSFSSFSFYFTSTYQFMLSDIIQDSSISWLSLLEFASFGTPDTEKTERSTR